MSKSVMEVLEGYEVSPQQQRVWRLQQQSGAYGVYASVLLEGALERGRLRQALGQVVARHEALRTSFQQRAGLKYPLQVIAEQGAYGWRESESEELSRSEQQPWQEDWRSGPVLRAHLVGLGAQRARLELSLMALCGDRETLRLLVAELAACYEAGPARSGQPMQYADFANWQNELLESGDEDATAGRQYWSRQQEKVVAVTLPFEGGGEGQRASFNPAWVRMESRDGGGLSELAAQHGSTAAGWLLGCWQVLLWRLSGAPELVIGEAVSGRKYEELAEAVGLYAKWLPLSVRTEPGLRFSDLVLQIEEVRRNNSAWQEYFAADASADIDGGGELLSIGFEYGPESLPYHAGGVQFSIEDQYACTERFKIKLSCERHRDLLRAELHYDASVYQRETIERFGRHFAALLDSTIETPEATVSELSLMSVEDSRRLCRDFNQTQADYPADKSIQHLFEEQVERTPDNVAVVCGAQQLTYAELNARANQLAHLLQRLGLAADVRVGLCLERSPESLVAILGIIKAGGAYVPLSEDYPKERLRLQLAEIESPVLITQEKFRAVLSDFKGNIICLDSDRARIESEPKTDPEPIAKPQNLVYVLYTSGSSGTPKGVAISHRSLVNYTTFMCRELGCAQTTVPLHFASVSTLSADLGNTAIFPSLLSGGCLHLLNYEVATDAQLFADYLARNPIDVLKIVPSHLSALLTAERASDALPRKFLILGGEALPLVLLDRIERAQPACRVLNHYGPTETTVGALINNQIESAAWSSWVSPTTAPIGRPIANTEAYIFDERLRSLPIGVVGELYLGGAGLARGYLNQPAETAQRFVPHPSSHDEHARLYRTGDLARYWPDGQIEFVGRADEQVKVRGFRIELGEIETVLRRHSGIDEAVVVAREDKPGFKRLVAYVVRKSRNAPTAIQLQEHIKEHLPEYMAPSAVIMLEQLPLTPNGKIDRCALPAPEEAANEHGPAYVAPGTEVERTLAAIWQEVLRVERVGIYDNFFAYGGDSILSIQIVARARQAGFLLTPKQLFQSQTIAELASVITTTLSAPHAEQGPARGEARLTPIQHWFFEQALVDQNHFNQSLLLRVPHELNAPLLRQAVAHLLEHHDTLHLRFKPQDGGWRQFYSASDDATLFTEIDLSGLDEVAQRLAIEAEASRSQRTLNLSAGPLLRVVLWRLDEGRANRLLIVVHHLVMDGVSWRILLEDLQSICEQLQRGEKVQLPLKTSSYKEWADRLHEYAQSETVTAELPYWLATTSRTFGRLPLDISAGINSRDFARHLIVELDEADTEALLKELPVAYRTEINDALLTALALAVRTWSGGPALLLEFEGHGREEIEADVDVTRTVGWFTIHYPVRLSPGDDENRLAALLRIKEQLRGVPRRGIGYGLLRWLRHDDEITQPLRDAARPEIKFNYLGQMDQSFNGNSGFMMAPESAGEAHSAGGSREHVLEITAGVLNGRLSIRFVYGEQLHQRETIERLAASYVAELRALIHLSRSAGTSSYIPSDFPAAQLNQHELDRFLIALKALPEAPRLEDLYRLSPMQEGMFFHSLLAPESDIYFRQMSCSLRGPMDVAAFERSWQRVIDEHPVLRTSFHWKNLQSPLQMISRDVKLPLAYHDWRALPPAEQEPQWIALLEAERNHNFDLTKAPLMRLVLVRIGDDVHQLIWSYHHLLMDGWAKHQVFNQILALYRAYEAGQELALESRRPYREYINWLQQQDMDAAKSFWQQSLKGFTRPTAFAGRGLNEAHSEIEEHFDKRHVTLNRDTTMNLHNFARRHQLTLNTVVQGAWSLLLAADSGSADVVFGAVMSGRPPTIDGAERMIGLFINTLPVRVRMDAEASVVSWLRELQDQQLEVRQYEYAPLAKVQNWSEIPKGESLFTSLLTFENYPIDTAARQQKSTVEVRDYTVVENNNYPVTLMVGPGDTLSLLLIYKLKVFSPANAKGLLERMETLLTDLAAVPSETTLCVLQEKIEAAIGEEKMQRARELKEASLQKFKTVKRRAARSGASTAGK